MAEDAKPRSIHTAIDLQDLGLDQIEETGEVFRIGAMVTLRDLELHPGLQELTQGAMAECVKHIVGVQFRNVATVGGSIYSRFGFSDVLTLFMALGAQVELYHHGVMGIQQFAELPRTVRDVLVRIIIPKASQKTVYLSQRNVSTDFPVLTCAVCQVDDEVCCVIGARPGKAVCICGVPGDDPQETAKLVAARVKFGSNTRAGAAYRARICEVLVRRALTALNEREG